MEKDEVEVLCDELKAIKETREPQFFDPPRKMYVWDDGHRHPVVRLVTAFIPNCDAGHRFITSFGDSWGYCCEIVEKSEPKSRRATNWELAKWLAHGNGEIFLEGTNFAVSTQHIYSRGNEDELCGEDYVVRKWGDNEWHEPTIDYLGIKEG